MEETAPDLWLWDTWPLREQDGSIAVLPGGWHVIFSLTATISVLPGKRHDIATIRYFYSRDGQDWIPGGRVFPEGDPLDSRQWAGSAFVDDGNIYFFYTATGREGEATLSYEQRMAFAQGQVFSNLNGVLFGSWGEHVIILEPDGEFYQTQEQSGEGIIYSFRDPWYYKDPESGCEYCYLKETLLSFLLFVNVNQKILAMAISAVGIMFLEGQFNLTGMWGSRY